jgi:hypothetical protein
MKKMLILLFINIAFCSNIFSDNLIFPPELQWWLFEVNKINTAIKLDNFRLNKIQSIEIKNESFPINILYPVFIRWNYSATKFAYFNFGFILNKRGDKYDIVSEVDTAIFIFDNEKKRLFSDYFGPGAGINAIAWLRNNILVSTGYIIEDGNSITLTVTYYTIKDKTIEIKIFEYKNAFSNNDRVKLELNWIKQREDYFW